LTDKGEIDPNGSKIDFVQHKLLHAGLGAGLGALRGDAAAGAIGGLVSELVADTFSEKKKSYSNELKKKQTHWVLPAAVRTMKT
jgi:hypothetical protein